ncbi:MAG: GNAT family N-acetyltransferase [Elusimicrobiota bacterium]
MGASPSFPYVFEPLGDHDRTSFSCGIPQLDNYLRLQARQDAKRRVAAPFVMLDQDRHVVGYYTLSAYGIRLTDLPLELAKKLPKYPLIPATLLGRLAISREHQGQKLGRILLMDALYRSWKNTSEIASAGVVAEAYDEAARKFYLHHEFISPAEHPLKLFIAMETIEKAFATK